MMGLVIREDGNMTDKAYIKWLRHEVNLLFNERIQLRKLLGMAADAINDSKHGHTPNWRKLVKDIEKYEDDYAELNDPC